MTDDDIARLRGLAQAAKEADDAADRAEAEGARTNELQCAINDAEDATQEFRSAANYDVLLRLLDERDALRRERDEAQRDARELRFLWEQRGERANKAEDERDAAVALLRVAKVELENAWRREEWAPDSTADALNRIDALLGGGEG